MSPQETILRLVTAAALGAAVGLERERMERVAGLRTHMIVCLGAALVTLVSAYGFDSVIVPSRVVLDPSRVAAQVVSGIGFLGAGTILFWRQEVIRGLTTAASLWTVAAIGLAAGSGLYLAALVSTGLILAILALVKPVEKRLFHRERHRRIRVGIDRHVLSLREVEAAVEANGGVIKEVTLMRGETAAGDRLEFLLLRKITRETMLGMATELGEMTGVRDVSWSNQND